MRHGSGIDTRCRSSLQRVSSICAARRWTLSVCGQQHIWNSLKQANTNWATLSRPQNAKQVSS